MVDFKRSNGARLLDGATTTGSYCAPLQGGTYLLVAECANWNGAILGLAYKGPNGSQITVANLSLAANGASDPIDISIGAEILATVAGTPSAGIVAQLEMVRHA